MSDEKLVKEAAKVARGAWREFYAGVVVESDGVWKAIAKVQRDFWSAHAEPAEMDTAKAIRIAAEVLEGRLGCTQGGTAAWLRAEADRLDREQRENARNIEIGRKAVELWDQRIINDDTDAAAYGREIRKLVEATE